MKIRTALFAILFFGFIYSYGQTTNRVSPMDSIEVQINELDMKIVYSRPYLKGRTFGKDIVPFGKVWRTGANEATVFEINEDINVEGHKLNKGKYSLYTIPDENETTVIFNKDWNQWGTIYNEKQDALRVIVPTHSSEHSTEQFTISIEPQGEVCLSWGEKTFVFHVSESNN